MLEKKKKKKRPWKCPQSNILRCRMNIKIIDGAPASGALHTPQDDKVHDQCIPQEVMHLYL